MIVAPSVLSIDFNKFKHQLDLVNVSKATWIHFDVMDGHFVKNLTFGPDILKAVKKNSDLFMDVHLMVIEPANFVEMFVDAGADQLTFHLEAMESEEEAFNLINTIHQKGCKAGISIKPNTPIEKIDPFVQYVDLILIMSVEPGFGGQPFMKEAIERIKYAKLRNSELNGKALIQVDGGINDKTIEYVKNAGVDVVVAGSYIFKNNIIEAVESLC